MVGNYTSISYPFKFHMEALLTYICMHDYVMLLWIHRL